MPSGQVGRGAILELCTVIGVYCRLCKIFHQHFASILFFFIAGSGLHNYCLNYRISICYKEKKVNVHLSSLQNALVILCLQLSLRLYACADKITEEFVG